MSRKNSLFSKSFSDDSYKLRKKESEYKLRVRDSFNDDLGEGNEDNYRANSSCSHMKQKLRDLYFTYNMAKSYLIGILVLFSVTFFIFPNIIATADLEFVKTLVSN